MYLTNYYYALFILPGTWRWTGIVKRRQRTAGHSVWEGENGSEVCRAEAARIWRCVRRRTKGDDHPIGGIGEHCPNAGTEAQKLHGAFEPVGGAGRRVKEGVRQTAREVHGTVQNAHGLHGKNQVAAFRRATSQRAKRTRKTVVSSHQPFSQFGAHILWFCFFGSCGRRGQFAYVSNKQQPFFTKVQYQF